MNRLFFKFVKRFYCTNFNENCRIAEGKKPIPQKPGEADLCPACQAPLHAQKVKVPNWLGIGILLGLLGGLTALMVVLFSGGDHEIPPCLPGAECDTLAPPPDTLRINILCVSDPECDTTPAVPDTVHFDYSPAEPVMGGEINLIAAPQKMDIYDWDLDADGESDQQGRIVTVKSPDQPQWKVTLSVEGMVSQTRTIPLTPPSSPAPQRARVDRLLNNILRSNPSASRPFFNELNLMSKDHDGLVRANLIDGKASSYSLYKYFQRLKRIGQDQISTVRVTDMKLNKNNQIVSLDLTETSQ